MAFRWDLLKPTKTTLQRNRAPVVSDASAWYPVVWVYTAMNLAWLLKDGTIQVLPPTSGNVTIIAGVSATSFNELESKVDNLEADMDEYVASVLDNVITSEPTAGQYRVHEISLDANKKIIVTNEDTAE